MAVATLPIVIEAANRGSDSLHVTVHTRFNP
jgi:hypothetical protein